MPILQDDIKLLKSEVLLDTDDGGGRMTTTEVIDGQINGLFPVISDLDSTYGRTALRKIFGGVMTNTTASYYGVTLIISKAADDPRVSMTVFTTESWTDRRINAQNRLESYLAPGPEISGYLLENHIAGQRAIQIFQRPGLEYLPVNHTVQLIWNAGLVTERMQYVRVTRVTVTTRLFTYDGDKDYAADVITYELSDALRYDFPGSPPSRQFARITGSVATAATTINDTVVANAAEYHGCSKLAKAAVIGDMTIKAAGIHTQLVPSTQAEASALDQRPAGVAALVLATAPREVSVAQMSHTQRLRVTQETRRFNYVTMLTPLPSPGTVVVSYRAMEKWYTITDNGDGTLTGTGGGAGAISYTTGSMSITLSTLPDAGTNIIVSWADTTAYTNRAGQAGWRPPEFCFTVPEQNLAPNSITVTWTSAGVVKSATDNGTGKLTGDATGTVSYATGRLFIQFANSGANMIDAGGEFSVDYQILPTRTELISGLTPDAAGLVLIPFAEVPEPGTVAAAWICSKKIDESSGTTLAEQTSNKESGTKVSLVAHPYSYEQTVWYGPLGWSNAQGQAGGLSA